LALLLGAFGIGLCAVAGAWAGSFGTVMGQGLVLGAWCPGWFRGVISGRSEGRGSSAALPASLTAVGDASRGSRSPAARARRPCPRLRSAAIRAVKCTRDSTVSFQPRDTRSNGHICRRWTAVCRISRDLRGQLDTRPQRVVSAAPRAVNWTHLATLDRDLSIQPQSRDLATKAPA
jgi:hypothetical protein